MKMRKFIALGLDPGCHASVARSQGRQTLGETPHLWRDGLPRCYAAPQSKILLALMTTGCVCTAPVLDWILSSCLPTGPALTFQVTGRFRVVLSDGKSGTFWAALPSM